MCGQTCSVFIQQAAVISNRVSNSLEANLGEYCYQTYSRHLSTEIGPVPVHISNSISYGRAAGQASSVFNSAISGQ